MSKFDTLMRELSPENSIEKVSRAIDVGFNEFINRVTTPSTFEEFKHMMAEFYCHLESKWIGLERPYDLTNDWGRCSAILQNKFKGRGDRGAFLAIQNGASRGLYEVLKTVADAFAEQTSVNVTKYAINSFRGNSSADEQVDAAREYLERYHDILPSDLRNQSFPVFVAHFYQFLEHHPWLMLQMKRMR